MILWKIRKNDFQLIFVAGHIQGTANKLNCFIFNYEKLDWIPNDLEFGIFAANRETEHCHNELKGQISNNITDIISDFLLNTLIT